MKIFIVHASAGAGHTKAAEAVHAYIKKQYPAVDVKLVDILFRVNRLFRFNYTWGYSWLVKHMSFLWHASFWVTQNKQLRFITRPIASFTNRINTLKFTRDLIKENPDVVISTHFLSSEIAAFLKKSGAISSKIITIVTDFGVHPFWLSEGTDIYVAASEFTKDVLIKEGVPENKIWEFGIPIDEKFFKNYDKAALCRKIGINRDKFTVLVLTGSFGIGPIEEIIDLLDKDVQVLAVCAKNEKLFLKLKDKKYINSKIFGFINNVHELMAVSDMIVTKPGGLSTSELLSMDLVPIFIAAIPGQETENVLALKSYGIGVQAKDAIGVSKIVLDYKNNPDKLNKEREIIKKIQKPHAAKGLCDAICQHSVGAAR